MASLFPSVASHMKSSGVQRITTISAVFYKSTGGGTHGTRALSTAELFPLRSMKKTLTFPNSFTDIAMAAKMSSHKNVLLLVGCCLGTKLPTLVFEFSENGFLSNQIYQCDIYGYLREHPPMSWQIWLKIAREIAHAIAYIHTAFSRPIIHRDIKPGNIFLDQHNVPKLADFSLSIQIPEGESHVEDEVIGSNSFLCTNYLATSKATEKTDVYSFGMLLLVLSTRQCSYVPESTTHEDGLINYIRNCTISEMVDPAILAEERGASVEQQLQAVWV